MKKYRHDDDLSLNDWFCGAGGSTQGAAAVPNVTPVHAANHWARAIDSHAANFPKVDHWKGDIRDIDVAKLPPSKLFWASPECTNWSPARGKQQDFALTDTALPGLEEPAPPEEVERSRALMEEVPLYLAAMARRGRPVLAGIVENVTDIRQWADWGRWRAEIESIGYRTRLIALNSMHAQSRVMPWAPQSRDRLYLAYWHVSLGRDPDWDKWLRPVAWCPTCEEWVKAVQVFKRPGADMGRYRAQYVYRCPHTSCRNQVVEPAFAPAYTAIDWSVRGERIGDRSRPLAAKTIARIEAGLRRFARPVHVEAAGNTYDATSPRHPGHGREDGYMRVWPVEDPLRTLHTTSSKGVVVPPMMVPVEGREGKVAGGVHAPMRTQSTRNETAIVAPPMFVPAGGTWNDDARPAQEPLRARTTRETEAIVVPPMVVPLRTNGTAAPASAPLKTIVAGNTGMAAVVPPLVMRHNNGRGDSNGYLTTPVGQELRTLTTSGHQSLIVPPFIAELRGGRSVARPVSEPMATLTASGTHHGLTVPGDAWQAWAAVYQYDTGGLRSLLDSLPTQTTVAGDALLAGLGLPSVEECLFRMLEPHEIGRGMAFAPDYIVLGNRRERVRQYGNAVTPPVAEILVSALVECITGEDLERAA